MYRTDENVAAARSSVRRLGSGRRMRIALSAVTAIVMIAGGAGAASAATITWVSNVTGYPASSVGTQGWGPRSYIQVQSDGLCVLAYYEHTDGSEHGSPVVCNTPNWTWSVGDGYGKAFCENAQNIEQHLTCTTDGA